MNALVLFLLLGFSFGYLDLSEMFEDNSLQQATWKIQRKAK